MDRPIFIVGTGRCGSTWLFDLLAKHPSLAWPTVGMNRPTKVSRSDDGLATVTLLRSAGDRLPMAEPYDMWDGLYRGFRNPCRDLEASDCPNYLPARLQALWEGQCKAMNRPRFLTKWTGWGRIGFMERACPGGLYLHVVRDGRAVAWSLMQQPWWRGWQGPENWRWGPMSDHWRDVWWQSGRSFYVLAGIQWAMLAGLIGVAGWEVNCNEARLNRTTEMTGGRYFCIRYEELTADPAAAIGRILDWAGLEWTDDFRREVASATVRDANRAWRENCPAEEQDKFNAALGDVLQEFGYSN